MTKLAMLAAGAAIFSTSAFAGQLNCNALEGKPEVCVYNGTSQALIGIHCSGTVFSADVDIPDGRIEPKSMTVLSFGSGTCSKHMQVKFENGRTARVDGFNTSKNTRLMLRDPKKVAGEDVIENDRSNNE